MAALVLAVSVLCGTVAGSYQEVQAAEIVVGGALVGTLEEILLSFGIFLLPASMTDSAQNSDWWYSEDGNAALKPYYEDLATEYEKERFKVINGGGNKPQPSPTPEPGTTPEVTPVPSGDIPTFDELVAPALAGGAIAWANGAFDVMGKAVGNLWDKIFGSVSNAGNTDDSQYILDNSVNFLGKPYYLINYEHFNAWRDESWLYFYENAVLYSVTDSNYKVAYMGRWGYVLRSWDPETGKQISFNDEHRDLLTENNATGIYTSSEDSFYQYNSNMPVFNTYTEASEYLKDQYEKKKKYTKENIWVHPDLQETYQNNGKFEYPAQAPQPLQYPSAENLADLAKKLNPEINPDYSPEIAPNYVQELIQKLQKDPSVNPDPDPNPNPDPGTDPQPTTAPLPTVKPTGTPETPTPEQEASPYKADLREIFPFCIPFDLIHLLKVFDAEAEAPVFEFPLDIEMDNPWTGEKVVDYHHTFKLDMADYEPVIKILRIFQVIFFIIALMLITRQQMIKG